MKYLLLVPVLLATLSSCSTMNAMDRNRQAIDCSTQAICDNIRAVQEANESIEENRRQIEAINNSLKEMGGS